MPNVKLSMRLESRNWSKVAKKNINLKAEVTKLRNDIEELGTKCPALQKRKIKSLIILRTYLLQKNVSDITKNTLNSNDTHQESNIYNFDIYQDSESLTYIHTESKSLEEKEEYEIMDSMYKERLRRQRPADTKLWLLLSIQRHKGSSHRQRPAAMRNFSKINKSTVTARDWPTRTYPKTQGKFSPPETGRHEKLQHSYITQITQKYKQ
ncbi:9228_t:CDS:2 [Acaulospora morrowiae]|uniref:9228_t:CDS:1 n=1 Tax=Acaulospora morrowiae TaxID=94023 RepID=A0A9N9EVV2_9GLOM|nr:9228_t:CDS:2 [Acaulospora morrowiae]